MAVVSNTAQWIVTMVASGIDRDFLSIIEDDTLDLKLKLQT